MAVLPASEPFLGGLIRAFELLTATGRERNVLVWIEGAEIVVKDAAALAHPRHGLSRMSIPDIRDVGLRQEPAGAVLHLSTEGETLRLRGTAAVIDGFVSELTTVSGTVLLGRPPTTPTGRIRRLVARFVGV